MIHNNPTFIVNGLYYPDCPDLISAVWIMIDERKNPVATGDFISTVSLEYSNVFAAELRGTLSILAAIDDVLSKYPSLLSVIIIKIGTDYQLVIDMI